jgi:hypothetical protein
MKLDAEESLLVGRWDFDGSTNRADHVCQRIEWLTRQHLTKVASSPQWGDWEILFQDPADGRLWELTYPQGELQGGGPPQLQTISSAVAKTKYQLTG